MRVIPVDIVTSAQASMEDAIANLNASIANEKPLGVLAALDRIDMLSGMYSGFARGARELLERDPEFHRPAGMITEHGQWETIGNMMQDSCAGCGRKFNGFETVHTYRRGDKPEALCADCYGEKERG